MYYTLIKLYYDINCWVIGINIMWQWLINSLSFKSNFSPYRPELWKCFTRRILWVPVFRYAKFHRNLWEEFPDILKVLKNGYKLIRGLKTPTGRRHEPVGYLRALLRIWTATGTGKQTQLVVTETCTQLVWTVSLKRRQLCYAASLNFSFCCYQCCKFYILHSYWQSYQLHSSFGRHMIAFSTYRGII